MRSDKELLRLDDVTMRIRDHKLLEHTNWVVRAGEQWAILGPNGSGKSTLARTVAGELPSAAGHIKLAKVQRIGLVSFEAQAELYARELEYDQARHFSGKTDDMLTARRLLEANPDDAFEGSAAHSGAHHLNITHLLDRPFRHLSAGEMRKTLIVRALSTDPTLLILDEPFDGLDGESREKLSRYLDTVIAHGRHIILVTHRADELIDSITHVLMIKNGEVVSSGSREEMLAPSRIEALYGAPLSRPAPRRNGRHPVSSTRGAVEPIVAFEGVNVRYGEVTVLRDLSWRLFAGERWGLFGPNGSGKTTILNLIIGDHLQGYANDVRLFGQRRGSGESIWEIKRRIGVVTPNLQLGYRHSVTALEVVISGFFDSIGLYRRPTQRELTIAHDWLERLEISNLADRHFTRLSYGQRRLLLIARAMVKGPELLVLDEPCQGLDPRNRHRVLDAIDTACESTDTALLYVTHHDDERPDCLTNVMRLGGPGEPATIEQSACR